MRSFMTSTPHHILFGVIKSRRIRWAWHVACMGERSAYGVLEGIPEGKR
jgi:hypothetical protein